ncbi:hypothetical protein OIE43_09620 [Streptomyces pseudovenezuelae]|uniref:hypothetical protein n=1 Tax=Streptomyces pseudovenezuelae TaxID=67350 RepID=UPI002E335190|nr:hypothetical protein [Streptomyces pseudovenezuelae]
MSGAAFAGGVAQSAGAVAAADGGTVRPPPCFFAIASVTWAALGGADVASVTSVT